MLISEQAATSSRVFRDLTAIVGWWDIMSLVAASKLVRLRSVGTVCVWIPHIRIHHPLHFWV